MSASPVLHIALPVPLYQNFEYLIPSGLQKNKLLIGTRVKVPFGKRKLIGILVDRSKTSSFSSDKLKSVIDILDTEPVFEKNLLDLLFWAASYYQQPLGEVLNSALPSILRKGKYIKIETTRTYHLIDKNFSLDSLNNAPKQKYIAELLNRSSNGLETNDLNQYIRNWRTPMRALTEKGIVRACENEKTSQDKNTYTKDISLNQEQQEAYETLHEELDNFFICLLAGITGSGKTEVYLALARDILQNEKQVLFLVPEIGLTPQLVKRIEERLGIGVALLHSGLNESERAKAWLSVSTGNSKVIVGTRSAVFASFANLGLIIVDEEHDLSFKQQDGFLYHARDVAVYRAKQLSIPIILGSATPSFESLHNVNSGRYKKLILSTRAQKSKTPHVKIIDLRAKNNFDGLSIELLDEIQNEIDKNHQVLLFLNRRGFAPTILCQDCGWIAECSRCDAHMVYYQKQNSIKCHHCLKEEQAPTYCARCNSQELVFLGEGTQRIEKRLREIFPTTEITRIDRDSVKQKYALSEKLNDIQNGKYQIIIGTQMLSKGHDFPNVTLVGILNVDHGLVSTDFRATERLAQLIIQVSGRSGRGVKSGKVLLQTYQPEHPVLQRLLTDGYEAFCKEALIMRQSCALPPFTSMIIVRARSHKKDLINNFLVDINRYVIQKNSKNLNIFGPIPARLERKAGMYHSQLVVIATNRKILQKHLKHWTSEIQRRPLTKRVRWDIEVDPLEMD